MPLFMDIHRAEGVSTAAVEEGHRADMHVQGKYGVTYSRYWFNPKAGKIFCLCEAPNADAARRVHKEAHGMVAEKIIEVDPELIEGFFPGMEMNAAGAVIGPDGKDLDSAIRTVLFTDIVGSTDMTQRLGDDAAMVLLEAHDAVVRDALKTNGGREVKHTGDGIMGSFVSAAAAVRAGAQIQRGLVERTRGAADGGELQVRIGAAAGEPVERAGDIFGSTVQLAARLCAHAEPMQVLVSNAVVELCIGKGLPFRELGEVALKGFKSRVRVHAVEWAARP